MGFTHTLLLGVEEYAAQNDRLHGLGHHVAEGVLPGRLANASVPGDPRDACLVTVVSGFTVSVEVGWCYVQGDHKQDQGMYCDWNDGVGTYQNEWGPPPGSGNRRIDLFVAQINDSEHTGNTTPPLDQMGFRWVRGTTENAVLSINDWDGSGDYATEAAANGWPVVPDSALVLAAFELRQGDTLLTRQKDLRRMVGPAFYGRDGVRYLLTVSSAGQLVIEDLTGVP